MKEVPLPSVTQHTGEIKEHIFLFCFIFKDQERNTSNLDHYFILNILECISFWSYQTQLSIQIKSSSMTSQEFLVKEKQFIVYLVSVCK